MTGIVKWSGCRWSFFEYALWGLARIGQVYGPVEMKEEGLFQHRMRRFGKSCASQHLHRAMKPQEAWRHGLKGVIISCSWVLTDMVTLLAAASMYIVKTVSWPLAQG